jgi:hypothetical protein
MENSSASGITDGELAIYTTSSGTTAERMRIDSSGNVGIGTSSPTARLTTADGLMSFVSADANGYARFTAIEANAQLGLFRSGSSAGGGYIGANGDASLIVYNGSFAERMRIDSSGNVGIGLTSAGNKLEILGSVVSKALNTDTGFLVGENGSAALLRQYENRPMLFFTNNTERMRIDSSGNLLVGKTTTDIGTQGTRLDNTGRAFFTRSNGFCAQLNRLSSDGDIVEFRKDGSTVGSIGSYVGNLYIGSPNGTDAFMRFGNSHITPSTSGGSFRDAAIDLGQSGGRFKDVYATNGTIQTSDRNEKQDIAELSDAEQRVAVAAKGLLRKFRWRDAVEEKGDEARIHFGIIAQDLQAAFAAEGLDAGDYAMFIHSTWTDEETGEERSRMGVRYSELLAFIIAAI